MRAEKHDDVVLYIHHNKSHWGIDDKGWHLQELPNFIKDTRKRSPAHQAHIDKVTAAAHQAKGMKGFAWYNGRRMPAAVAYIAEHSKGPQAELHIDKHAMRRAELLDRFNGAGNAIVTLYGEIVAVVRGH